MTMTLEQLQQAYAELEHQHKQTCNELQALKNELAKTSVEAKKGNICRKYLDEIMEYVDACACIRYEDVKNLLKIMRDVMELGGNPQNIFAKLYTITAQIMENVNLLYDGVESIEKGNFDYLKVLREKAHISWGF